MVGHVHLLGMLENCLSSCINISSTGWEDSQTLSKKRLHQVRRFNPKSRSFWGTCFQTNYFFLGQKSRRPPAVWTWKSITNMTQSKQKIYPIYTHKVKSMISTFINTELMTHQITCTSYVYSYKTPLNWPIIHFYLLHFL